MLKKLLTLCLALVMLSSVALASPQTYVLAAETEDEVILYEETFEFASGKMQFALYDNDKKTATISDSSSAHQYFKVGTDAHPWEWLILRIEVGENWNIAEAETFALTNSVYLNQPGDFTQYVAPLTKEEYDAAVNGTLTEALDAPSTSEFRYTSETVNSTGSGNRGNGACSLTANNYVNSYDGQYIYLAIEWITTNNSSTATNKTCYAGLAKNNGTSSTYKFQIKAPKNQEIAAVTASKEIVEIRNDLSKLEQTVTLNPAEPYSKGLAAWLLYKFELGKTFTDVTKVTLDCTWTPDDTTAYAYVFEATQSEYDAAKAETDKTLKQAEQHSLLKANYRSGKSPIGKHKTATTETSETFSFDLTDKLATVCKSGVVYLEFTVGNSNADKNNRFANNIQLTLTVEGTAGEYTAPAKTIEEDNCFVWDNGTYKFYTPATSGEAVLIATTYSGTEMVDAKLVPIDAATKVNGAISGNVSGLTVNEGETLKLYLWQDGTLTPILKEPIVF